MTIHTLKFPLEIVALDEGSVNITDADSYDIASDIEPWHAALIVECVNSHSALLAQRDALAKALERIANFRISAFKSYQEDREEIERIARAALAGVTK
jgi:hypothetical protein